MLQPLEKRPLWEAVDQTKPEEVLEADTAASLVALLHQVAGLVEHSAAVFGNIQKESQKVGARCAALDARCSKLRESFTGLEGKVKDPACAAHFIKCSNGYTFQPLSKRPVPPTCELQPSSASHVQQPSRQGVGDWLPLRCRFSPVHSPAGSPLPDRPPSLSGRLHAAKKSLTFPSAESPSAPPPPLDLPFGRSGDAPAWPALVAARAASQPSSVRGSPPLALNQIPVDSPLRTDGMAATPKGTPQKGAPPTTPLPAASPQQPGNQDALEVLSNPLYMMSLDVQSSLPQRIACPPETPQEGKDGEDSDSAGAVSISARSESGSPAKQEVELVDQLAKASADGQNDARNQNPVSNTEAMSGLASRGAAALLVQEALETDRSAVSVEGRSGALLLLASPFRQQTDRGGFDHYPDIVHEFGSSSRDLGPLGAARSGSLGLRGLSGMLLAPGHAYTLHGHLSRGLQDLSMPLPSHGSGQQPQLETLAAVEELSAAQTDSGQHRPSTPLKPAEADEIVDAPIEAIAAKEETAFQEAAEEDEDDEAAVSEGTADQTPFISARSNRPDESNVPWRTPRSRTEWQGQESALETEDYDNLGPAYMRNTHPRTPAIPPELLLAAGPLSSNAAAWKDLLQPPLQPSPDRPPRQQAAWERSHYSQYVLHGSPGRQSPRAVWARHDAVPSPVPSSRGPNVSRTVSPAPSWRQEDHWVESPAKAPAAAPTQGQENMSVNSGYVRSVHSLSPVVSPLTSPLQEPSPSGRFPRRFGVGPYMAHRVVVNRGAQ